MKGPLVSIIIPCYNCVETIAETLDSVLCQTHTDIEIICVDDGSNDKTGVILKRYKLKHPDKINVIKTKNLGGSSARNKGFELSKGDFIQLVDADDKLHPTKLESQLKSFQSNTMMVYSDYDVYDTKFDSLLYCVTFNQVEKNPLFSSIKHVISNQNPLYKRIVFEELNGYDATLSSAQDWEFNIRVVLRFREINYLPGIFSHVRKRAGSVSSDWLKVSVNQCKVLTNLHILIVSDLRFDETVLDQILNIYFNTLVHLRSDSAEYQEVLKGFEKWYKGNNRFLMGFFRRTFANVFGIRAAVTVSRLKNRYWFK